MDEIRELARAHSPALKAQELEAKALGHEASSRGKWQNPVLSTQFGGLSSGSASGPTFEVSLTQAVPVTDRFSLKRELAEKALENQVLAKGRFANWVEHQALLAAWRARIQSELYSHGVERAERVRLIERYLESSPRASIRQRVELSLISGVVLQLQRELDRKKFELKKAEDELSFWIGRETGASEVMASIPSSERVRMPPEGTHEKDPEWQEARKHLELAGLEARIASKERWPDLIVGAGYRVERVSPVNRFSYGILGLSLPLWDTGSSRSEMARARLAKSGFELEEAERRIRLKHLRQLEQARFDLLQVKRFSISLVPGREKTIREAEEGFKRRLIDVNTFLQAETQTHEMLDQIYLSWQAYLESLSSLLLMQGESLSWEKP
jgi:hypothetical protein